MGQNVRKNIYFGLFGGPWGIFNVQTGPILLSSDEKFLSLNPKYDKNNTFFHIWGVLGDPYVEPR